MTVTEVKAFGRVRFEIAIGGVIGLLVQLAVLIWLARGYVAAIDANARAIIDDRTAITSMRELLTKQADTLSQISRVQDRNDQQDHDIAQITARMQQLDQRNSDITAAVSSLAVTLGRVDERTLAIQQALTKSEGKP